MRIGGQCLSLPNIGYYVRVMESESVMHMAQLIRIQGRAIAAKADEVVAQAETITLAHAEEDMIEALDHIEAAAARIRAIL